MSKSKRVKLPGSSFDLVIKFPGLKPEDLTGVPLLLDETLDKKWWPPGVTKEMVIELLTERKGDK